MSAPATALVRTPADIAALKRDAWAGFTSDYVLAVDADPAEARARYRRKMELIEQMEAGR
jgi:hypothetical protein